MQIGSCLFLHGKAHRESTLTLFAHYPVVIQPYTCRGRNTEGQCGVENKPVLLEPAVLQMLETEGVQTVLAGKQHSAAVLASGEVCTWGCGKAGKLGHGSSDNFSQPTRYT